MVHKENNNDNPLVANGHFDTRTASPVPNREIIGSSSVGSESDFNFDDRFSKTEPVKNFKQRRNNDFSRSRVIPEMKIRLEKADFDLRLPKDVMKGSEFDMSSGSNEPLRQNVGDVEQQQQQQQFVANNN